MNEINRRDNSLQATFAGGCFWCMVDPFVNIPGVIRVVSGYTGGHTENPSYAQVCAGGTGHFEAVQVTYNPNKVSYEQLLEVFWRQIDPTDAGGQFLDRGSPYRTAIFYHGAEQRRLAEESKKKLTESLRFAVPVATEVLPADTFYPAEEYHQDFHKKNPEHYQRYRAGSGRDAFIKQNLKTRLTALQYEVTQQKGTEPPFRNEYWDNKRDGIYVDIISGVPLFSSTDKFDSGCGWPSFTKPLDPAGIQKKKDLSHGMVRDEVRSTIADSHLGHVFHDGPAPEGLRYCINSAALRFIPKEEMSKEGYGEYLRLFE